MMSSAVAWRYRLMMLTGLILCFILNKLTLPTDDIDLFMGLPPFLVLAVPLFLLVRQKQWKANLKERQVMGMHLVRDLAAGFALFVALWTFFSQPNLIIVGVNTFAAFLSVFIGGAICVYLSLIDKTFKKE